MTPQLLIEHLHRRVGSAAQSPTDPAPRDPDSLIGFFQSFRPDGKDLAGLFDELGAGPELGRRLTLLYQAAGDDRRPQGGRDAYFVVRQPPPLDPAAAQRLAAQWLAGVREIAMAVGDREVVESLDPLPSIRVLEGIAPKHPKAEQEKSPLLRTLQQNASRLVHQLDAGLHPEALRPAYYFIACDEMLRDYLMWPFYVQATGLHDPLEPYFDLWRHGVKYRIFSEAQVDLYLPRRPRSSLSG